VITLSFDVTKDDVLELACQYYALSPTVRSARLKSQTVLTLLFLVFLAGGLFVLRGDARFWPLGTVLLACAGLSSGCLPRVYRSQLRKSAEKMIAESSYANVFGRYTLEFGKDGLASTSPTGESKHPWRAINRVFLATDYLFIFLAGPQGYPIPRAQVPDSAIQEAKAFVESHLHKAESGVSLSVWSLNLPATLPTAWYFSTTAASPNPARRSKSPPTFGMTAKGSVLENDILRVWR
jgi:hypothetical protein